MSLSLSVCFLVLSVFLSFLKFDLCLIERQGIERDRQRKIAQLSVHSLPRCHNSWCWAKLKPGARDSLGTHVGIGECLNHSSLLDQKQSILNLHFDMESGITAGSLASCTTILDHGLVLLDFFSPYRGLYCCVFLACLVIFICILLLNICFVDRQRKGKM